MSTSFVSETELPGRKINLDTLQIIAHRYYWASELVHGKDVLEVGCGPGLGLGWLSRNAKRTIGGDITEESIALAKEHYGPRMEFVRMDAHKLPFKDNSLDAVVCLAAIIYMDLPAFLDECHRALRTDSILVINTPNKDLPSFRPSRLSRKYYSVPELYLLLNQHHFDANFFGAFPATQGPTKIRSRFLFSGKIAGGKAFGFLGLYKLGERLTGFQAASMTLRKELREEEMRSAKNIQVTPIRFDSPDIRHRIVYAVAHAR